MPLSDSDSVGRDSTSRREEKRDRERGEEAREQCEVQRSEDLYDGRDDKLSLSIRCDVTRCDKCYGTVS